MNCVGQYSFVVAVRHPIADDVKTPKACAPILLRPTGRNWRWRGPSERPKYLVLPIRQSALPIEAVTILWLRARHRR